MDASKNKECPVFGLDIGTRSVVGTVGYKKNTLKAMIKGSEYRYPYFAYLFLRLDPAITIPPKTAHHSTGAETNEILLSLPVAPSPYFSL